MSEDGVVISPEGNIGFFAGVDIDDDAESAFERCRELVQDPILKAVSVENMERIIEGMNGGKEEPTDEELLLRVQGQSHGFADLVRRGFEKMERDCGL